MKWQKQVCYLNIFYDMNQKDSSLLTVFRPERLTDNDTNLMDKLIERTVEIAIEKVIEAKNAELKNNYNYDKANACRKLDITIQWATTLF